MGVILIDKCKCGYESTPIDVQQHKLECKVLRREASRRALRRSLEKKKVR